jgi:hypothetical protein
MLKHVLVSRMLTVVGLTGALTLGCAVIAKAQTNGPFQFAVQTTASEIAAPVRNADFNSTDRQNMSVQPVHWGGRGPYAYYGGGGYYRGGFYGGPRVNYGYRPYSVGYRAYYSGGYRPYYAYRQPYYGNYGYYGYGAGFGAYAGYYPPYYNYTYFRAPYYASPPVYVGYPQQVYYAPSFATYGNCYYW